MATAAVAVAAFEVAALEAAALEMTAPEIPDPPDDGADRAAYGADEGSAFEAAYVGARADRVEAGAEVALRTARSSAGAGGGGGREPRGGEGWRARARRRRRPAWRSGCPLPRRSGPGIAVEEVEARRGVGAEMEARRGGGA